MEFIKHLEKYLLQEEIDTLLDSLNEKESKHALLLNTEKMTNEQFEKEFPLIKKHPFIKNIYLYDEDIYSFGKHLYFDLGVYYLFEPCSPLVSYFLNPTKDDIVLDACAAPGGKSTHASLLMENEGILLSNEISKERANILSSNIERMGRKNVIVASNSVSQLAKKYKETFTKIILDAPCSGSGMFRKESKMKEDWTYSKVLSCASLQKELILECFSMLQEGGTMVYSTCSFSYEEDEEVIEYLLQNEPSATLEEIPSSPYFYKSKKNIGIHLFPHLYFGEGHYICLIKKEGNLQSSLIKNKEDKFIKIKKECNVEGYVYKNDSTYYLTPSYFDTKGIYVLRGGLKLGEEEKYGFEFDYALSHYLKDFPLKIDLDLEQTKKYLFGEQLSLSSKKGTCLLCYNNIGLGFGKSLGNRINNKYPKGLRKKY